MLSALGTKDMYEAWENMYQDFIEGYKTPEGETTQALKVEWITKLPKIFCMQVNRLKFEDGNPVKSLNPFIIEPVIYADRFMIKNKEQSEKIRKYVHSLRDKIKSLEKALKEYQSFNGSDSNIARVLDLAASFFKEQGKPHEEFKQVADITLFSPLL